MGTEKRAISRETAEGATASGAEGETTHLPEASQRSSLANSEAGIVSAAIRPVNSCEMVSVDAETDPVIRRVDSQSRLVSAEAEAESAHEIGIRRVDSISRLASVDVEPESRVSASSAIRRVPSESQLVSVEAETESRIQAEEHDSPEIRRVPSESQLASVNAETDSRIVSELPDDSPAIRRVAPQSQLVSVQGETISGDAHAEMASARPTNVASVPSDVANGCKGLPPLPDSLASNREVRIDPNSDHTAVSALTTSGVEHWDEKNSPPQIPARAAITPNVTGSSGGTSYTPDYKAQVNPRSFMAAAEQEAQAAPDLPSFPEPTIQAVVEEVNSSAASPLSSLPSSSNAIPVADAILVPAELQPPSHTESAPQSRNDNNKVLPVNNSDRKFWVTLIMIALVLNSLLVAGVVVGGFCAAGKCSSSSSQQIVVVVSPAPTPSPSRRLGSAPPSTLYPTPTVAPTASPYPTVILGRHPPEGFIPPLGGFIPPPDGTPTASPAPAASMSISAIPLEPTFNDGNATDTVIFSGPDPTVQVNVPGRGSSPGSAASDDTSTHDGGIECDDEEECATPESFPGSLPTPESGEPGRPALGTTTKTKPDEAGSGDSEFPFRNTLIIAGFFELLIIGGLYKYYRRWKNSKHVVEQDMSATSQEETSHV